MITEEINTKELFSMSDATTDEFQQLVSYFSEETINETPFEGSWTAAQVAVHITKSNRSMVQGLYAAGKPATRKLDERLPELKTVFLDFTTKLKSPEFILPTQQTYQKDVLLTDLQDSARQLKEASSTINLSEAMNLPALGEMTKLEMVWFTIFHTQRHIHQLKNISQKIHQQ